MQQIAKIYKPHDYQDYTTKRIIDTPKVGVFLDMGLGKTVSTLTAIDVLSYVEDSRVLIVAPKKVAESTWSNEVQKWTHTQHMTISKVMGAEKKRIEALKNKADIYITNRDNIAWLVAFYGGAWPFDTVILDESSSYKNPKSSRFKALRRICTKINRLILLTGTPSPNGLEDLWSQLYLLDQGERLGGTLMGFRDRYFRKDSYKPFAKHEIIRNDDDAPGESHYEKKIYEKISDICFSMKSEDYLDLPKRVDTIVEVVLPDEIMKKYYEFEKELVLSMIDETGVVTATNAAVLSGKLRQFANGAVYDAERKVHLVHNEKLQALDEQIESTQGQSVLVFYQFQHDLDRLMEYFKSSKPRLLKTPKDEDDWNAGKIKLLFAHPRSAGHGLNLQHGGHIMFWFGLDWSSENYNQAVKRLDRQGQTKVPINGRIICKGTLEERMIDVVEGKIANENALMTAVKAIVAKYT